MKRPREKMRRLLLQQLERRCVMDASGFDELVETSQVADLEATTMMYTMGASDVDFVETSASDGDLPSDTVDLDPARVMFFSMAGGASSDEQDTDGLIAASAFSDNGSGDASELERNIEDPSIQTFGATSTEFSIESDEEAIEFILDIDQNGLVSAVDVWMIINSLNSPDTLGSGAEFDVNGDSVVSPLDVLIVINELNNAQAGVNGFAAPAVSSSRLATRINPEWMTNSDDSTSDESNIEESTAANSLIAGDDFTGDESADESSRLVDSAFAELDDSSDDASFVGRLMSIVAYKIDPSLDDASKEDLSDSAADANAADETEADETLIA